MVIILSNLKVKVLVTNYLNKLLDFFGTQLSHWKWCPCSCMWRTSYRTRVNCQQMLSLLYPEGAVSFASASGPLPCTVWDQEDTLTSQTKAAKTLSRSWGVSSGQSAQHFLRFLKSLKAVSRKLWVISKKKNFETNYQKGLITLDPWLSLTMNDYKNSALFCTCGGQVNEALLYLSVRLC